MQNQNKRPRKTRKFLEYDFVGFFRIFDGCFLGNQLLISVMNINPSDYP